MKIIFIENRFRTIFWREIASLLRKDGHEVRFIIQNKSYHTDAKNDVFIPYPKSIKGDTNDARNFLLIESDRNINYFKHKGTAHYDYYRNKIEEIIDEIQPDIIFGESTAFHELITIDICKERKILYLHPSTNRYPSGRFSFYLYDTLDPFKGSGEELCEKEASSIVNAIAHRTTRPFYMEKRKINLSSRFKRAKELILLTKSYIAGEHYNTPNPITKREIEKLKQSNIVRWDTLAKERNVDLQTLKFKILYPMQMQPEANLDVWGRPFRNQLQTIKQLVDNTPEEISIVVKPNPKSKYELTPELLEYINSEKRIIPISHNTSMDNVLPSIDLVVTVTGTIAIECILSNKPVVTLIRTINNNQENCLYLNSINEISSITQSIMNAVFPTITEEEKHQFINILTSTSYPGYPYETHLTKENLQNCLNAFKSAINSI